VFLEAAVLDGEAVQRAVRDLHPPAAQEHLHL
jgi:hypothetical protein